MINIHFNNQGEVMVHTDAVQLRRIIENLVKNAVEASEPSDSIRIDLYSGNERVRISVVNPRPIPEDVVDNIFKRSFSTKGEGRGLGTYSSKILCEDYLNGKLTFTTSESEGTEFIIDIPREWHRD